ncbi:MAG TPA: hypothetical protein VEV44_16275, partial [Pseudoneobacillus sp.]|nr:hypothetical protein [Pseudoneobacillus sp.]
MGKNVINLYVPPASNTGALNTEESGLRSLVDWVSFTLKNVTDVRDVVDILGLDFNSFRECPNGDKGYMEQIRFGDISILYNGREDMGIHVNISGQGCRQFETYSNMDWSTFFALL